MAAAPSTATSTLDEPIWDTVLRDVTAIGRKMVITAVPMLGRDHELRDWDLWGPLVLCCILAFILAGAASEDQAGVIFCAVFVLVWVGPAVVTVNAKLLGSKVSFFQTTCAMGYSIAPLCVAAIIAAPIGNFWATLVLTIAAFIWASYAALRFLRGSVPDTREVLVIYPAALFFFFLSWMMVVGL